MLFFSGFLRSPLVSLAVSFGFLRRFLSSFLLPSAFGFFFRTPSATEAPKHRSVQEGLAFGLHRAGRVLLGDEMGLGKTLQALGVFAGFLGESKHAFVRFFFSPFFFFWGGGVILLPFRGL